MDISPPIRPQIQINFKQRLCSYFFRLTHLINLLTNTNIFPIKAKVIFKALYSSAPFNCQRIKNCSLFVRNLYLPIFFVQAPKPIFSPLNIVAFRNPCRIS